MESSVLGEEGVFLSGRRTRNKKKRKNKKSGLCVKKCSHPLL